MTGRRNRRSLTLSERIDAEAEMLRRVEAGESVADVFGDRSIDPAEK